MTVELAIFLHCLPADIAGLPDVELATIADVLKQRSRRK